MCSFIVAVLPIYSKVASSATNLSTISVSLNINLNKVCSKPYLLVNFGYNLRGVGWSFFVWKKCMTLNWPNNFRIPWNPNDRSTYATPSSQLLLSLKKSKILIIIFYCVKSLKKLYNSWRFKEKSIFFCNFSYLVRLLTQ